MKYLLFYDTETTGLPFWKERSSDPRQPHIVQLAAKVVDSETRSVVHAIDVIIKPDGWTIPPEVSEIHGITTDHALRVGIPEQVATVMMINLSFVADTRIAHNESFDSRIMRIALYRFKLEMIPYWRSGSWFRLCTMKESTPILNLPPKPGGTTPKWPTLDEAYRFFKGDKLENAHNAMVDVDACIDVYFGILDYKAKDQKEASK